MRFEQKSLRQIESRAGRNRKRHMEVANPPQLWHHELPGPLWDGTKLVSRRQIRAYCRIVAREFRPQKIILFGSYASGNPTRDSDVDLLVVMPFRGRDTDMAVKIQTRVGAPFPMDLLVWKPGRLSRMRSFNREVLTRGKVIYEG